MPKRTIVIQNQAYLSSKDNSLVVTRDNATTTIPFEDIWVLIIESHQVTMSNALLSDLADAGIGILTCGKNHMPNGLMLPLAAHSRHAAIVEDQLLMSKPLKKQLWQKIVRVKIANQAKVMELLGIDGYEKLIQMVREVKSGDSDNREAVAASYYFAHCLPEGTRRDGPYTAVMDYGYSVVRAGLARAAVAGGWLVSQGIHHSNNQNAFNLVDDLIEPFRPVVDLVAFSIDEPKVLSSDTKAVLVSVFENTVLIDGNQFSVQTAITQVLNSLKAAVTEGNAQLLVLPEVVPLRKMEVDRK